MISYSKVLQYVLISNFYLSVQNCFFSFWIPWNMSFNSDLTIIHGSLYVPFWLTHIIFIYLILWIIFKNILKL